MHAKNWTCLQSNDSFLYFHPAQNIDKFSSLFLLFHFSAKWQNFRLFIIMVSFFFCHRLSHLFVYVRNSSRSHWHVVVFMPKHLFTSYAIILRVVRVMEQNERAIFIFVFFFFSFAWKLVNGAYKFSINCVSKYNDNQKLHTQCNHRVIIEAEKEIKTKWRRRVKDREWNWKLEQWFGSSQTRSDNKIMEVVIRYGKKLKSASLTVTMSFAAPNYEKVCECII